MARVGFIGLGSQGGPMASRIIEAGNKVTLWARNESTLIPFANTGARFAESIEELADEVEHVAICVVDDAGVQQVCDQLIPSMKRGGCVIIHSTVKPQLCKQLAQQAADRGVELLDAPVSGGGAGAANGTLTVMVGGSKGALAAVRPVMESYAGKIIHLGGVGCGQNAKLVNNTLMAANFAIAHYGLQVADALGIHRPSLVELVQASSGCSFGFEVYARQDSPFAFKHGASLLVKDMLLLEESLVDDAGSSPILDLALPLMESIVSSSSVNEGSV